MTTVYGKKYGRFIETPLDWAACGTEKNHRAHYRRGEQPCEACRRAANEARARRRRRAS